MPTYLAPGRVNVIGEHTDHAGGLALAMAIDRGITLDVSGRGDRHRLTSSRFGDLDLALDEEPTAGWGRYVAAVAHELRDAGVPTTGLEGRLSSDLPAGAGLSSSGALEVVVARALLDGAERTLDDETLIRACRDAEERAVGVPCGLLDQATIVLGRPGHVVFLSFAHLGYERIPWPADLTIVVAHSGITRRLEDSPYAERRRELLAGLAGSLDPAALRRVRHLRSENERVREVVAILRRPRPDARAIGRAMLAGHASLRDDFEVSTPELDRLVESAVEHGAYGARLTGAGFGGSIVALTDTAAAPGIRDRILADSTVWAPDRSAQAWIVRPSGGASRMPAG